jgi:hypothetical protein
LKTYYDKYVLSVHALIVLFQFFVSYLNEKIKLEVLASSFEITSFEKNLLQRPKSGDFDTEKCLQEAAGDSVK